MYTTDESLIGTTVTLAQWLLLYMDYSKQYFGQPITINYVSSYVPILDYNWQVYDQTANTYTLAITYDVSSGVA